MAALPAQLVEAPAPVPAKFNLLDTIPPIPVERSVAVEYDSQFCGVARPWDVLCVTPDLGDISVSVDNSSNATITSTGLPDGTYRIVWGDGTETAAEAEQLNEVHDYAATEGDGTYLVQVYKNGGGLYAEATITVEDGSTSGPFTDEAVRTKIADDGITVVTGAPIPVYHLFSCRFLGHEDVESDGPKRAEESLDLGASRALEEGFQTVFATGAVDVTPSGTAVDPVEGLGLLEQYAAENYGGRPVIHMSRLQATLLMDKGVIERVGDHLETGLGSLVVAGGGYDPHASLPSAPAAGAGWMYATGAVVIRVGKTGTTPIVPNNPYDNEFSALAERTYVPTFECFKAAVEVTESVS